MRNKKSAYWGRYAKQPSDNGGEGCEHLNTWYLFTAQIRKADHSRSAVTVSIEDAMDISTVFTDYFRRRRNILPHITQLVKSFLHSLSPKNYFLSRAPSLRKAGVGEREAQMIPSRQRFPRVFLSFPFSYVAASARICDSQTKQIQTADVPFPHRRSLCPFITEPEAV